MAHMIDKMAYVGQTPWHGLGTVMQQGISLDQWRVEAGLDWEAKEAPVCFNDGDVIHTSDNHKVLFRSDRKNILGVVSDSYKTVQPADIIGLYDKIASDNGFRMETMGSLADGKRIWALAQVGEGFSVKGNDTVMPYLLLATSYDKTMATRAMFTTVRVVCNNTLQLSVNQDRTGRSISHNTVFNADKILLDLGLLQEDIGSMKDNIVLLSDVRIKRDAATNILADVLFGVRPEDKEAMSTRSKNILTNVVNLFDGRGIGSDLQSAAGTAWGLVNAVTQFTDHSQGNSASNRINSAWFGTGATTKEKIWDAAMKLAA